MRHQVKYTDDKDTVRYGLCYGRNPEAGMWEVSEVITGEPTAHPDSALTDIPCLLGNWNTDTDEWEDQDELATYVAACSKQLWDKSYKIGPGLAVGKMLRVLVGDGYAHYEVTEVDDSYSDVAWRGLEPDRYTDRVMGWGRSLDNAIVTMLIGTNEVYNTNGCR